MSGPRRVTWPERLEYLVLLVIASSLTAVWLTLWAEWTANVWSAGSTLPSLWPLGLVAAGVASSVLTEAALGRAGNNAGLAKAALAGAGAMMVLVLVLWAGGSRAAASSLFDANRLAERLAAGGPAFLAAVLACWQGERLGRSPMGNQAIQSTFYAGIVALAGLILANSLVAAIASEKALGALMLYFALGLTGLTLSSRRQRRQQQTGGRLTAQTLGRQWLASAGATIGLVLGAAVLVARVAAPAALERLAGTLGGLLVRMTIGFGFVLAPTADILDGLLRPGLQVLALFLARFMTTLGGAFDRLQGLFALLVLLLSGSGPRWIDGRRLRAILGSPAFQAAARWTGLLAAVAAVLIIFWLAARRFWGRPTDDEDEQRESVLTGRLLAAQLRKLLQGRARPRQSQTPNYLSLAGAPDDARLMVRRAYQAMLEWARSLRLPRAAGQTPRAYAQMLAGAMPEGHEAIYLLTQTYVVARYAAEAPSLEAARQAEAALARLKALHN